MVDIFTHIIQIVVFAACANALLRVGSTTQPGHGVGRVNGVEEDGLELGGRGTKAGRTYDILKDLNRQIGIGRIQHQTSLLKQLNKDRNVCESETICCAATKSSPQTCWLHHLNSCLLAQSG